MAICAGRTDSRCPCSGPGHPLRHLTPSARREPGCWAPIPGWHPASRCNGPARLPPGFHARHRATRRIYRYAILQSQRSVRPCSARGLPGFIVPLDAAAMHAAAQVLIGEHDFSAFRSVECQSKTPVRRRIDAIAGDCATATIYGWRLPPPRTCTIWCATSSTRWWKCKVRPICSRCRRWARYCKERGPPLRGPHGSRRRPCICGGLNILQVFAHSQRLEALPCGRLV